MQRQPISFQGREFDTAYRPAVQFKSCYIIGTQHLLKCPTSPSPQSGWHALCHHWSSCVLPLGQRLWKMTWPSSEAEFSCGYGKGIAWWALYTVREDLEELLGGLFSTAGRFSLVHHLQTGSQESVGSLLLWRYYTSFGYFVLWTRNLFVGLSNTDCKGHCERTFSSACQPEGGSCG